MTSISWKFSRTSSSFYRAPQKSKQLQLMVNSLVTENMDPKNRIQSVERKLQDIERTVSEIQKTLD